MQGRQTSWCVAALILAVGALAALPFQRAPLSSSPAGASTSVADGIVWQDQVAAEALASFPALATSATHAPTTIDDQVAPVAATAPAITRTTIVPRVPDQYGNLLRDYEQRQGTPDAADAARAPAPIPTTTPLVQRRELAAAVPLVAERQPVAGDTAPLPPSANTIPAITREASPEQRQFTRKAEVPAVAEPAGPPVVHIIRDGDTLSALAERYLGDAARAMEIFEANRQLLQAPELLPIGKPLTMPSRQKRLSAITAPLDAETTTTTLRRLPPVDVQ